MPAPVVGDATISTLGQKNHLIFPGISAKRPAMAENDWLSLSSVLVVDLRSGFGGNRCHGMISSFRVLDLGARASVRIDL